MKTGIVGLVQTGKTTIFNILTGATAATGAGARKEANIGVAPIPDDRLNRLSALFEPHKTVPATAQYVDLPGVEPSGMKEAAFLTGLRAVDALLHVVRAFHDESVPHPAGEVDPARDIANMELEMVFADLFQAERRLERLDKDLKKIKDKDLEAERELLVRFRARLEEEKPLRELALTPEEDRRVRGFTFLSQKPILHVINMDEADAAHIPGVVDHFGLAGTAARPGVVIAGVCGKIEEELSRLSPEEANEFMADLGIGEPGTHRLLRENYALLGLISFFTVGKDEVRAWTIPRGMAAQQAAGRIHSDLEKGFIRAEVSRSEDLLAHGSLHVLKEKGLQRLEGKEYIVQDGDVFHVRFAV
jgi:GTP-binding protein YchF